MTYTGILLTQLFVGMRIRRIPPAAVRPKAVVDGPVLIEADMNSQIDNREALSVHPGPSREIVLTLVSDDNFLLTQRTILLQFEVGPVRRPGPTWLF